MEPESPKKFDKDCLKNWFIKNINKPIADKILYLITFSESSFFPLPPDPFLAAMTVFHPKRWFKYALWTTIYSVLGGLFGYLLGYWFFEIAGEPLINLYNLHEELQNLGAIFNDNAFVAVFLAAFTPIPYKVFTISAGLFHVSLISFILASIIGRGTRFFILAALMRFVGEKMGRQIFKYFNLLLIIGVILLISLLLIF